MACLEVHIREDSESFLSLEPCLLMFHLLFNVVERGEFTADAPGIPRKQTKHINIIHLVLQVDKGKSLRMVASSHQAEATSC